MKPLRSPHLAFLSILAATISGCDRTEYARPDIKAQFQQIRIGDTLDAVYARLGPPLQIGVNPDRFGDGAYRQYWASGANLDTAKALAVDKRIELGLCYSRPLPEHNPTASYVDFSLRIIEGQVEEIRSGTSMD